MIDRRGFFGGAVAASLSWLGVNAPKPGMAEKIESTMAWLRMNGPPPVYFMTIDEWMPPLFVPTNKFREAMLLLLDRQYEGGDGI